MNIFTTQMIDCIIAGNLFLLFLGKDVDMQMIHIIRNGRSLPPYHK